MNIFKNYNGKLTSTHWSFIASGIIIIGLVTILIIIGLALKREIQRRKNYREQITLPDIDSFRESVKSPFKVSANATVIPHFKEIDPSTIQVDESSDNSDMLEVATKIADDVIKPPKKQIVHLPKIKEEVNTDSNNKPPEQPQIVEEEEYDEYEVFDVME